MATYGPILEIRKLRLREVKGLAQNHSVSSVRRGHPGLSDSSGCNLALLPAEKAVVMVL